ncbi:MAG: hypothetical protein CL787_05050 [Chloroflexi bacterium]|nr:hypothetical protein [Chloroflexota bacterium]MQG00196.1 hypothetical protein [SAR202 cluster bacterium]
MDQLCNNPSIINLGELNHLVRSNWYKAHPSACTCANCEEKKLIDRQNGKIGRNEKCPCGSGKKYKRCHGD